MTKTQEKTINNIFKPSLHRKLTTEVYDIHIFLTEDTNDTLIIQSYYDYSWTDHKRLKKLPTKFEVDYNNYSGYEYDTFKDLISDLKDELK